MNELTKYGNLTFRELLEREGKKISEPLPRTYSLQIWFADAYDRTLRDFSDSDLGIACRQDMYLEFVLPFLIEVISHEPLAGDKYDGELLMAAMRLPIKFWDEHPEYQAEVRHVAIYVRSTPEAFCEYYIDDDLLKEIDRFLGRTGPNQNK